MLGHWSCHLPITLTPPLLDALRGGFGSCGAASQHITTRLRRALAARLEAMGVKPKFPGVPKKQPRLRQAPVSLRLP